LGTSPIRVLGAHSLRRLIHRLRDFASSLTENQIVAAVLAFGVLLFFWVIGWAANFVPPKVGNVLTQISLLQHFDNFAKGIIDTKDIVYYLTLILFFLFLTLRSLESKKWRG